MKVEHPAPALKPREYSREREEIRRQIRIKAPRYASGFLGRAGISPDEVSEFVALGGSLWERIPKVIKAPILSRLKKDSKTIEIIREMDDIPQIILEALSRTKYGEAVALEWLESEFQKFKADLGEGLPKAE